MLGWVPLQTEVRPGFAVGRTRAQGIRWQLVEERHSRGFIVLLQHADDSGWSEEVRLVLEKAGERKSGLPEFNLDAVVLESAIDVPRRLAGLALREPAVTSEELALLAPAIGDLRTRRPLADLDSALFIADLALCLSETDAPEVCDLEGLAQAIITGGVRSPRLSVQQMRALNPWIESGEIAGFLEALGIPQGGGGPTPRAELPDQPFRLVGRPGLEKLFQEEVVDYWRSRERYVGMGVSPPGGLLLHGPPGSGKTYAIRQLAAFLGWPLLEVESSNVGSSYAHGTSRAIASAFADAASKAPAMVLLEELDALGLDRGASTSDFRREEVATLLQQVERAPGCGVLVMATTNDISSVDAAFLRPGRFEHVIEVGYPNTEEAQAVLEGLLQNRPAVAGIDVGAIANRLSRRSLAEARWLVDRAARIAVAEGKDAIDELCLQRALKMLQARFSLSA